MYSLLDGAPQSTHAWKKGDGHTDDTAAIKSVISQYAGCKIIFFDAGTYIVSDTIAIPAGTQIVGEVWSQIMGTGSKFTDYNNPQPVIQVGTAGSTGIAEITDMIFTTRGPGSFSSLSMDVHRLLTLRLQLLVLSLLSGMFMTQLASRPLLVLGIPT
jgi:hypothetical protein